jgi:glycosyltransferase involved in cell wall biosynthesis
MGQVHGILAEVPDPAGTLGSAAKRLRDAAELRRGKTRPHFLGAIGLDALSYYRAVSSRRTEVFEFGYFPELRSSGRSAGRKGPIRLAAIGSLMAHKGFDLLIEALARLPQNDVTLSIAGSGPDEAKLKALSARLGLSERVVFAGLIPPTEMPGFLEAADLAVMPSRYDGWGAVANEALAVGTPILVSEAYGARSLLVSPILGAVFPAGSAESLLEALSTMVRRMEALRSTRHEIADWARRSITPAAGARYLSAIVRYSAGQQADRPVPCWKET